jgi:hypothetical protein
MALTVLLTCTVFGQPQTRQYHFIVPVIDQFDATAGIPMQLPLFLENHDTNTVQLTIAFVNNGGGTFAVDSLDRIKTIAPGQYDVAMLNFFATSVGTYTAMLTATDGMVTDTLQLTATVTAGPGPFVIIPPFQEIYSDLGRTSVIPVSIRNLSTSAITVTLTLHGDSEFSYSGTTTKTIPAMDGETVLLEFFSDVPGRFTTSIYVSDGSYTDSAMIAVVAYDEPYTWVIPLIDNIETMAGIEAILPVMVRNSGATPVTLTMALTGAPEFTLDPASTQVTLQPGMGEDIILHFLSNTIGTYNILLTVTDGVTTDSLPLSATVLPGPGNFAMFKDALYLRAEVNQTVTEDLLLESYASTNQTLNITISGSPEITYTGPSSLTLLAMQSRLLPIEFSPTSEGTFAALLTVSDGIETDSAVIIGYADRGHNGGPLFTLDYDGFGGFMAFETPLNTSLTKDITIRNISGQTLPITLNFFGDSSFTVSHRSVTIDSGASATVSATFDNSFGGYGGATLTFDGGLQVEQLYLSGMTPPFNEYDGVLVTNMLDFGMVDSAQQFCLDVMIENTTMSNVTVTGAMLSGFSSAYVLQAPSFPLVVPPSAQAWLTVCFQPTSSNRVENEVLTISFDNPSSTPLQQTAIVNLTGRSTTGMRYDDSCGVIGWYVNTIAAPIGGQSDATIELFNITGAPLTLDNAVWEDGNSQGIYSIVTPLPITIQPMNPAAPNSGKADFTIRYAPTAQSSTVGVEDIATLRLESSVSGQKVIFWMTLVGIPMTPSSPGSTIVLFPKDNRVPAIDLGETAVGTTQAIRFENNLQAEVTVKGFGLASDERFEITNALDFPRTLQPGETVDLMIRTKSVPSGRITDVLTMQGSHEHLNSRFDLISGTKVTDVEALPGAVEAFTATLAPNPATDRVKVSLSEPLVNGQIQVLDMLGRVLLEHRGSLQSWTWDGLVNGVPAQPGVYQVLISGVTDTGRQVSLMKKAMLVR